MFGENDNLGKMIRRQRMMVPLTLQELGALSGVSPSHLGRIERGGRFPSAHILRKIAGPLHFEENELFALAGYLSSQSPGIAETHEEYSGGHLDPYVSSVLAQEPLEVQRAIIGILTLLKSMSKSITE